MACCELTYQDGDLALKTPYDAAFVAALHAAVPRDKKTWRKPVWLIDPAYQVAVIDLVQTFYGERLTVQTPIRAIGARPAGPDICPLQVLYLGRAKPRDDGSAWASGYQPGDSRMAPSLIFPEQVLRGWFHQPAGDAPVSSPAPPDMKYATLGIPPDADAAAIKTAYRRLAKQWHPDVCREPNATAMFRAIQAAYDFLSDPIRRKRYDAGLALQASLHQPGVRLGRGSTALQAYLDTYDDTYGYRAPLRCGMILAEVVSRLGKLHVQCILGWEDITDRAGRTLVTSWPQGADFYEKRWI